MRTLAFLNLRCFEEFNLYPMVFECDYKTLDIYNLQNKIMHLT